MLLLVVIVIPCPKGDRVEEVWKEYKRGRVGSEGRLYGPCLLLYAIATVCYC